MSTDVLANFTCLDELIQVIYQGVHRFVVLSTVTDQWTIHLGLSGPEGRWWRGTWAKTDILEIVVRTILAQKRQAESIWFVFRVLNHRINYWRLSPINLRKRLRKENSI